MNKNVIQPFGSTTLQLNEHRANIRSTPTFELSVDYVVFADGTFWGADTRRHSEMLAGSRAGARAAVTRIKEHLKSNGTEGLQAMLERELENASNRPVDQEFDQRKNGFQHSYNSVLRTVKDAALNGLESVVSLIDKTEQVLGPAE